MNNTLTLQAGRNSDHPLSYNVNLKGMFLSSYKEKRWVSVGNVRCISGILFYCSWEFQSYRHWHPVIESDWSKFLALLSK